VLLFGNSDWSIERCAKLTYNPHLAGEFMIIPTVTNHSKNLFLCHRTYTLSSREEAMHVGAVDGLLIEDDEGRSQHVSVTAVGMPGAWAHPLYWLL
jgi:hypothetical protein